MQWKNRHDWSIHQPKRNDIILVHTAGYVSILLKYPSLGHKPHLFSQSINVMQWKN